MTTTNAAARYVLSARWLHYYSNLEQTVKGGMYSNCQNTNNATCIGLPRESFSTGGVSVEVLKAKERFCNKRSIKNKSMLYHNP